MVDIPEAGNCNCGEKRAEWVGVPSARWKEEYPDSHWFFCNDCMEGIFEGRFAGGHYNDSFDAFYRLTGKDKHVKTNSGLVCQDELPEPDIFYLHSRCCIVHWELVVNKITGMIKIVCEKCGKLSGLPEIPLIQCEF